MYLNQRFLKPRGISGLEFMDFQNTNFYDELVRYFESQIDGDKLEDTDGELNDLIFKYTGFRKIEIHLMDAGNACIDAGYINPGNLFNVEGIEDYLPKSQSTLYQWFKNTKRNVMYGEIDFRTGKVGGAYSDLKFNLYINRNLDGFMSLKELEKHGFGYAEGLAGVFCHELGHAFGGVMMIHTLYSDNFNIRSALWFMAKAENQQQRVAVIKDFARLSDIELNELGDFEKVAASNDTGITSVYLNKLIQQRNVNRTAGLGVSEMNSEVIADAYSVRMGCSKALPAALVGMNAIYKRQFGLISFVGATIMVIYSWIVFLMLIPGIFAAISWLILSAVIYMVNLIVPGGYNTSYRRLLNIKHELVMHLKTTNLSEQDRKEIIKQINHVDELANAAKPFFEGTAVQRFFGWLTTGGKFKFTDLEHYSQNVANHSINGLADSFKALRG